jgi:CRISPR/Cas system CMR subunit Cmr6 (Cas7 group RAMP superfamily)
MISANVKAAMNLNDKEAEKFWSIYDQYKADLMKLSDRRLQLIKDHAANFHTMTDDKAGKLAKTAFELQKSKINLLESYYKKVSKAVSNKVAVRFAQVENVMNSALDLKLGTSIPLMPKQ